MSLSQSGRVASVTTPLGDDLNLWRVNGGGQLSQLFVYELDLLSEKKDLDLKPLLGKPSCVSLFVQDGAKRSFHGIVTAARRSGMIGRYYHYQATLRPKAWLLTQRSNCRIFQKKSVPDIAKMLLGEHGVSDIKLSLTGNYAPREYCVQYRESDFNLISRLLEEEGIYYFFEHSAGSHTLVLCDSFSLQKDAPVNARISYFPDANTEQRKDGHVYGWDVSQEIHSGKYEADDFNFEMPSTDLTARSSKTAAHAENAKEMYDYPGGYLLKPDGDHYASVRMEELRCQFERISARGNARQLAAGMKFTLVDFPAAEQNRGYVMLADTVQIINNGYESFGIADTAEQFYGAYRVIPDNTENQFRPPRLTPMPFVQGPHTAIVVGPNGEEIYTDKYGRVKLQFHWDREGKKDENSSLWVRVAQVWAGSKWGAMHIPRIGQEVIVEFLEGNPDRPIVIGRVYNAEQMPPYDLPGKKTQSGIKSRSTKQGTEENFNEIRFEDEKGKEEVYIHAEKDFTRIVENNDVQKIGFDKKEQGNQTVDIYNDRTVTLDQGHDSLTVKTGNRSATIKMGNDSLAVKMGNRTVKVDLGKIEEEAMQSIELKVGQSSVKIDQMGVTIKGMMISIEGQVKTDVKGVMTTVNGDAMLTLKGGLTMVN